MPDHRSSYRQIFKATSLFGGVQVLNIIISVIRSKFVAIWLGPAGMGIMGLLTSSIGLIGSMTNFGLSTSAIKDIATANSTNNQERIGLVVKVFRRLIWITGIAGTLITITLAPYISQFTFGNKDFTLAFIWISITLLINQLSSGQLVVLQGLRKLKKLAKANLAGSLTGLFIAVPLYYIFGVNGIVPAIIGIALASMCCSWFFSRKIKVQNIPITGNQIFSEGKSMLGMGFMLSLSSLLTLGSSYLIRIFISRTGGLEDVGLYNAGFAIVSTYVGLIFTAMTTDYYPRLSAVSHDNQLCRQNINQQAEIAVLILAPILITFIVFIKWVIIILYSRQFLAIDEMLHWVALGMFFKAASWAVAYIFLAKGENKLFFFTELIANFFLTLLSIVGYHFWGLSGIGYMFVCYYLGYLLMVYMIGRIRYNINFDKSFILIASIQFLFSLLSLVVMNTFDTVLSYVVGVVIISASSIYSFIELDKRLGVKQLIKQYQNKIFKS